MALSIPLLVAGLAACPKDSAPATADDAGSASTTKPSATTSTAATPSDTASAAPSAVASADSDASAAPKASTSSSATAAGDEDSGLPAGATCGKKPLPDCPLQAWMKSNVGGPMQAKNFPAIAAGLRNAVALGPPGYGNWASICQDGAKAADAQNLDGVKKSCSGCHNQYQTRYRTEMRDRKI
jgi:hypothetical protein